MSKERTFIDHKVNAGRILVVGSQGGGKTALATKVSALGNPNLQYKEDYGGTIETEYLKVSYDKGKFFSLLLPIGGQEKWSNLRTAFGETAEGMIVIMDSTTKLFWPTSILQARSISPRIPYEDFPTAVVVTKQDQNSVFQRELKNMCKVIVEGFDDAHKNGIKYYARGFKVVERSLAVPTGPIPFSIGEQIIVNALEKTYFEDVVPGSASGGVRKLKEFSLVNCRLFSRALASSIAISEEVDQNAFLSLLNDHRPTLLELDSNWEALTKRYPKAGKEPLIPENVTEKDIENAIKTKLLATDEDVTNVKTTMEKLSSETGWFIHDVVHSSVFTEEGLQNIYKMIYELLVVVQNAKLSAKFTLLDPLEELF